MALLAQGLLKGALEVPFRGAHWVVTSDRLVLFTLLALVYLLLATLFGWASLLLARQRSLYR